MIDIILQLPKSHSFPVKMTLLTFDLCDSSEKFFRFFSNRYYSIDHINTNDMVYLVFSYVQYLRQKKGLMYVWMAGWMDGYGFIYG